jgi:hypothetical protein
LALGHKLHEIPAWLLMVSMRMLSQSTRACALALPCCCLAVLLPGYYALSAEQNGDAPYITAAKICPQGSYCPSRSISDGGEHITCNSFMGVTSGQLLTLGEGSTSADQCSEYSASHHSHCLAVLAAVPPCTHYASLLMLLYSLIQRLGSSGGHQARTAWLAALQQ